MGSEPPRESKGLRWMRHKDARGRRAGLRDALYNLARASFWHLSPRKSDQMEKSTSARLRRYRRKLKAPIVPPKRGSGGFCGGLPISVTGVGPLCALSRTNTEYR